MYDERLNEKMNSQPANVAASAVKRLVSWLCKLFSDSTKKIVLPDKDPMDWKLTTNSKRWWSDQYCPQCKSTTTHNEFMADICNDCGFMGDLGRFRSSRKIYRGGKWVLQRKYGNGKNDYVLGS